jgi:hypothetical protein
MFVFYDKVVHMYKTDSTLFEIKEFRLYFYGWWTLSLCEINQLFVIRHYFFEFSLVRITQKTFWVSRNLVAFFSHELNSLYLFLLSLNVNQFVNRNFVFLLVTHKGTEIRAPFPPHLILTSGFDFNQDFFLQEVSITPLDRQFSLLYGSLNLPR